MASVKLAIDFDSRGYITEDELDCKYSDILFTEEEMQKILQEQN